MTYSVVARDPESGASAVAMLTMSGEPRGRQMLDEVFAANPGWRDLIPRLVTAGTIPDLPGVVELLTGSG